MSISIAAIALGGGAKRRTPNRSDCAPYDFRVSPKQRPVRVDLTRSPNRRSMTAICAHGTAGVDVKLPFGSRRRPSQLGESLAKAGANSPFDSFSRVALRSCPTASLFHRGDDDAVKFETSNASYRRRHKGSNDRGR
jgi:hypothetical protein